MKRKHPPYSVSAILSGETDTQMLEIVRQHDRTLARLQQQKLAHPDVTVINDMIEAYRQSREIAVGLLELPHRAKQSALVKTASEAVSRL